MSYDLMVFETGAAPKEHRGFIEWYFRQTKWNEGHSYNEPGGASARLQAWFADMIALFPPLNGPLAKEELPDDEGTAADYSIGRQFIYIGFVWSKAETAYQAVVSLAAKHQLGFFDVSSSEEEVWIPEKEGLTLAHKKNPPTFLGRIKHLLRINIKYGQEAWPFLTTPFLFHPETQARRRSKTSSRGTGCRRRGGTGLRCL